jgi:1,2-diacylglycerol 3-alpha-glucosyltransferase
LCWCTSRVVPAVVMSESQAIDEPRVPWKEVVKRRVVGVCAVALAGGQTHAEYLAQLGMPTDRIFLGYDAVDNRYFEENAKAVRRKDIEVRRERGLPERYFLASARFVEKKNLPRLLEAYAKYRSRGEIGNQKSEIWKLVLLGDGELRSTLFALRSSLGLDDSVLMPGFKQYPDLPAYYGLASALVHASTTEQWGLVVNEAMASGLPVLVSNRCGCAPDLVQEGVNGFTFDPYNTDQLADLMVRVSRMDPAARDQMGTASRRIIADWGPERFATGLQQAVECALRVGPKRVSVFDRVLLRMLALRKS